MPSPLGHFTIAYSLSKSTKRFSLPGLIVGSIMPDLNILITYVTRGMVGREALHSIVGAGTLGTFLATFVVVLVYPVAVSTIVGLKREDMRAVCRPSAKLVASAFVGGLSHILVDATCHPYNPLFYPFTRQSIDVLLFTSDWGHAYLLVELLLIGLLGTFLFQLRRKGVPYIWRELLVGTSAR